jgi:hypothetical protein
LSGPGNLADSFRRPSYTTAIKTGEAAILFPRQETAWGREYLARAAVCPLEGSLTLAPEAAKGNGESHTLRNADKNTPSASACRTAASAGQAGKGETAWKTE